MGRRYRAIWWGGALLLCLWVVNTGVSPAFTPVRAELVAARGFSRGVLNLVVLDRNQAFPAVPLWASVLVLLGFLLAGISSVDRSRTTRVFAVFGAALFVATALSAHVTTYRVVLAPRTFALGLLCIWSPWLAGGVRHLTRTVPKWAGVLVCGALGSAFFASAMLQTLTSDAGNYSAFLHLSRDVAARAPFLVERPDLARSLVVYDFGYDGQFMYLMAFDPFLQRFADRPQAYRAFIDSPPYRYGRIGFALLTRAFAAGHEGEYPFVMMWLIVAAHFALASMLASLAVRHGWPPWIGLLYLAIPGFMSSLMSALPEALAAAGLVAGYACWERGRYGLCAGCFAAVLLIRETPIVLVAALVLVSLLRGSKRSAVLLAVSIVPAALWRSFVAWRLFSDWGWGGVLDRSGDLGVPFAGLVHLLAAARAGIQPSPEIAAGLIYPMALMLAAALALWLAWTRRGPLEIAAALYALLAVSLRYDKIWSHLPSGERGTYELFLCLLLVLIADRSRSTPAGRHALMTLFAGLALYTLAFAPDAATSRTALLLIR